MRWLWLVPMMVACGEPTSDRADAVLALTGDPVAGAEIYANDCAVCHAASGLGEDDPDAPGIGANLTDASGEVEDDAEFVGIIVNGEGQMTPFPDLTDQEIADVLAYIHTDLIQ